MLQTRTNPYDAENLPRHLQAGLTKYMLEAFAIKSPPYHVTADGISTSPILVNVDEPTRHHCVRGRGGATAVFV